MTKFFTDSEYQKISHIFNLGDIKTIKYFNKGLAAPKVLVVTSKGSYVIAKFKVGTGRNFHNKPRKFIQYEVNLLTSLKNLPVPTYVPHKENKYIYDYNGFAVTVYKYLNGRSPKTINEKRVYALGKFLGSFHGQSKKFKNKFADRYKFYDLPDSRVENMKPFAYNQTNKELKSVVKEVEKEIIFNRPVKNLPQGPIHVDIKSDNELFVGDKLTGIIDFGNFYIGPIILDVGKAIVFNCVRKGKFDKKLMLSFLRGYKEERRLNQQEKSYFKKSIFYAIYSHIWLDLYHVPLKLVPGEHTLYFVKTFLPAVRRLKVDKKFKLYL